ncbi:hypothetical protein KSP35_19555 [Aquihabitans sp. G128]|uniref:DUF6527 family protein n=1 Tax=Aquihabitans sp. G128 TaxID=2849779 RepID=UPI001C220B75|nr:DUF6527 family protein [Aquihabitans sp. G128]QXC60495.1 hypothetical protein KSP35_19555 [Aquihabitans sp. G128]HWJ63699.1 DUF6527 family protein [Acidimicrobiales bacterium]
MRLNSLQPEFIESAPPELTEGILYISIPFRTSMHLCACGCGTKVVMPIRPGAWHITYDGETVSVSPSIGNQELPCRSHYWIDHNKIRWMRDFTGRPDTRHLKPANKQAGHEPAARTEERSSWCRRVRALIGRVTRRT